MSTSESITLAPDDDARVGWVRWFGAHILGGIVGVGVGYLRFSLAIEIASRALTLAYRSDIPADLVSFIADALTMPALLTMLTVASATGGVVGYGLCQVVLRHKIKASELLLYSAVCAVLWPVVGILGVISLSVWDTLGVTGLLNQLPAGGVGRDLIDWGSAVWDIAALPGAVLGLALACAKRLAPYLKDKRRAFSRIRRTTTHRPL